MHDLRIGVIGFGNRGRLALEADRPGAGSVVVGVCDLSDRSRDEARAGLATRALSCGTPPCAAL